MASLMLTVAEAAELLGISRSTAYDTIRAGRFPVPVRELYPGGPIRISRHLLEQWRNAQDEAVA